MDDMFDVVPSISVAEIAASPRARRPWQAPAVILSTQSLADAQKSLYEFGDGHATGPVIGSLAAGS